MRCDVNYGYGRVNAKNAVEQSIPDHDLLIQDWSRTPYAKNGNVTVNATIMNYGANDESNIVVQLWRNSSMVTSKSINTLPSANSTIVELSYPAPYEAVYNITVRVVSVPSESDIADNIVWAYVGTEQGVIRVPDNYQTIQEAVDDAVAGDTIKVSAGTYNEALLVSQDDLSLVGESRETTIINGSGAMLGINVVNIYAADNFRISEFTLQNSGYSRENMPVILAGMYIFDSNNCTITDNIFSNNYEGIFFWILRDSNITGNKIVSCYDTGISGIEDFPPANNYVSRNIIESSATLRYRKDA
jgi:parallel beta-helix repeat protein